MWNIFVRPWGWTKKAPRFSWQLSSDKKDTLQTAVEIRVREAKTEEEVWDSGLLSTDVSTGITYEGKALKPCTAYVVQVEVTDNYGRKAVAETVFETGFLKKDKSVWEGADWIGAPDFQVAANARGVFVLESTFRMKEGSKRAGRCLRSQRFPSSGPQPERVWSGGRKLHPLRDQPGR